MHAPCTTTVFGFDQPHSQWRSVRGDIQRRDVTIGETIVTTIERARRRWKIAGLGPASEKDPAASAHRRCKAAVLVVSAEEGHILQSAAGGIEAGQVGITSAVVARVKGICPGRKVSGVGRSDYVCATGAVGVDVEAVVVIATAQECTVFKGLEIRAQAGDESVKRASIVGRIIGTRRGWKVARAGLAGDVDPTGRVHSHSVAVG